MTQLFDTVTRGPFKGRPPICSVDRCGREHYARGLCVMHYRRRERFGTVILTKIRQFRLTNKGRRAVGLPQRYVEVAY